MAAKPWTDEEVAVLRATRDDKQAAEKLGRSLQSVKCKRRALPSAIKSPQPSPVGPRASKCHRCGSLRRLPQDAQPRTVPGPVRNPNDGQFYERRVVHRLRCADCRQVRLESVYENV